MKDPKTLYAKLASDFEAEERYGFDDRGEGMLQATEFSTGRRFLLNTELKKAWELVTADGHFAHWNASDVELGVALDMPSSARRKIFNVRVPHYFGMEYYEHGVALAVWTVQPDGIFYGDEDGFGVTSDQEITLYAYVDREGQMLVPFQPMDDDLKSRYRAIAEAAAEPGLMLPYRCLQPSLTIPFSENARVRQHYDTAARAMTGAMLQMRAYLEDKFDDPDFDGVSSTVTSLNPDYPIRVDFGLYLSPANVPGKYELMSFAVRANGPQTETFAHTPFGQFTANEVLDALTDEDFARTLTEDLVENVVMMFRKNE